MTMHPLLGLHVIEFEGIGPGPLCGRILAAFGARVTLIARPERLAVGDLLGVGDASAMREGKDIVALNLKHPADVQRALQLIAQADALIEGNRPGVMERLGLGPAACAPLNPRLVYGRLTGWGQDGPLAQAAGHDLNYVALSGLLSLTPAGGGKPLPPPAFGDGGGALGLAFGIVSGVLQARLSGRGCVVDAAIVDLLAMMSGIAHLLAAAGELGGTRPSAFHDSPFYDAYRCQDGKFITIAAIEPQFYACLLDKLELRDVDPQQQYDTRQWPALKQRLTELFLSRPSLHWRERLEGSDACFAPALTLEEAQRHAHNAARRTFSAATRAQAAPRFSPLPDTDA